MLPIDACLGDLVKALGRAPNLIVEAPPGAGKTTRVPGALLDAKLGNGKRILIVEPRRIAARLAAGYVASLRGSALGEEVGYRVRHSTRVGDSTKLIFQTEGLLLRQLSSDPKLSEFGVVVFDEFHERSVASDLALALLHQMQGGERPDLKLVVMSATLNAAPLENYLRDCQSLRVEGRSYPVEVEYEEKTCDWRLEKKVRGALRRALIRDSGDVLIFLPGVGEIRRCMEYCGELANDEFLFLPLHGSMPADEQERAVRPASRRKVIFATNVAETSITIDGVTSVIDSGLARVASTNSSGLFTSLVVSSVSRASADQRAGRAGRTAPGHCYRLFTRFDYEHRAPFDVPEILRSDLTSALLLLKRTGVGDLESFPFISAPKEEQRKAGCRLLQDLGALDEGEGITTVGREMLKYPLHPRLGRLVVEACAAGIGFLGVLAAAILNERDFRIESLDLPQGECDVTALCDLYRTVEQAGFSRDRIRNLRLNRRGLETIRKTVTQLSGIAGLKKRKVSLGEDEDEKLRRCLLKAFPDRVAKRVEGGGIRKGKVELLLAMGGRTELSDDSVARGGEFLVAVDLGETRRNGRSSTRVRLASVVEPDWILDECVDRIEEQNVYEFSRKRERVETISSLKLGSIALDEVRSVAPPDERAGVVLGKAAWPVRGQLGIEEPCDRFLARIEFLREQKFELSGELGGIGTSEELLGFLCRGRVSFKELRKLSIKNAVLTLVSFEDRNLLDEVAPESVLLSRGRSFSIHYRKGTPPSIEGYIQDFFGLGEGPKIARGRFSLALHLMAPNRRPVQVTSDLKGFWERHYPDLSRSLARRYPRHHWPEKPAGAPAILLKRQLK